MDKLELDLDDLEVNSFSAASEQEEAEGTVQGNAPEEDTDELYTCFISCPPDVCQSRDICRA